MSTSLSMFYKEENTMEWRAYSSIDGECFGMVADESWKEEEALERAIELFGQDVYVELKQYF